MHFRIVVTRPMRLVSAAALLALTACAAAIAQQPRVQPVEIPFTLEDNRIFVKASVNGQGPFEFIVDTGAPGLTLNTPVAKTLGLATKPAGVVTGAGNKTASVSTASVASFGLGPLQFANQPAEVLDLSEIQRNIGFAHLDGIIGYSMLKDFAFGVDVDRQLLTFSKSANAPREARAVRFRLTAHIINVPAKVEGRSTTVILDTGDRSSFTIFGPYAKEYRMYGRFGGVQNVLTGFGLGGPVYGDVFRLPELQIFGARIPNVTTRASRQHAGAFVATAEAGSVGTAILKRFNIIYDYPRSTIYAWKSKIFASPDSYDRSGMWLRPAGARIATVYVVPNGPASRAGLAAGEIVVSVNGRTATAQNLFEIRRFLSTAPSGTPVEVSVNVRGRIRHREIILKELL